MKKTFLLVYLFSSLCNLKITAQRLKPWFDKTECIEMLKITAQFGDSTYASKFPVPDKYKKIYRSPVIGLDNCWDLWTDQNGVAVISLRGTTAKAESWLANFYAVMVPAKGELHLSDSFNFQYDLAISPRAAVHLGWLICTAFLSRDILPKIDSLYKTGTKDFYITGHSQGGAICFLLTSYLYSLQKQNLIPADIRFKTYCTAAPKVGNLYYAYDYEARTQFGWSYNVVNSSDWVPETMFTIQTMDDLNSSNPLKKVEAFISKQSFPKDLILKHFYSQMDKPTRKAESAFQQCLGPFLEKYVQKFLPGYKPPIYYTSMNYTRVGNSIVLLGDADYFKLYPYDAEMSFTHHFHGPYLYLADKLPANQ